jgi:Na+/H+ antiporter NhaC
LVGVINLFTANNTVAIITAGPIARELTQKYGVDPRRTASLLDTTSCCVQGMIPYGAQILIATSLASAAAISSFSIMKNLFYPVLMGFGLLVSLFFTKNEKVGE